MDFFSLGSVVYCTVLYCTVLYYTVLYCIVLYCTVLHCSKLLCVESLPVSFICFLVMISFVLSSLVYYITHTHAHKQTHTTVYLLCKSIRGFVKKKLFRTHFSSHLFHATMWIGSCTWFYVCYTTLSRGENLCERS